MTTTTTSSAQGLQSSSERTLQINQEAVKNLADNARPPFNTTSSAQVFRLPPQVQGSEKQAPPPSPAEVYHRRSRILETQRIHPKDCQRANKLWAPKATVSFVGNRVPVQNILKGDGALKHQARVYVLTDLPKESATYAKSRKVRTLTDDGVQKKSSPAMKNGKELPTIRSKPRMTKKPTC